MTGNLTIRSNSAVFRMERADAPENYNFRIEIGAFGNEVNMYGGFGGQNVLRVYSAGSSSDDIGLLLLQPSGKRIMVGGPMHFNGVENVSYGYTVESRTKRGLYFKTNRSNTTGILFSDNGNVIIGSDSDAGNGKLYVNGVIYSTGDQILSSDASLKTNLKPITLSAEQIADAPAVTFDWKDGHGHSFGSIAQYWKPILPEMVRGEEGSMTLAYAQGAMVSAIALAKEVVALKNEIRKLKGRAEK